MMSMEIDSFLSYLKNIKRYSALTITAYKEDLNQFREFCEKVELIRQDEEITSKMVRRFEMGLMSGGLKIGGVDGEEKLAEMIAEVKAKSRRKKNGSRQSKRPDQTARIFLCRLYLLCDFKCMQ